jgi:hypothetical protein
MSQAHRCTIVDDPSRRSAIRVLVEELLGCQLKAPLFDTIVHDMFVAAAVATVASDEGSEQVISTMEEIKLHSGRVLKSGRKAAFNEVLKWRRLRNELELAAEFSDNEGRRAVAHNSASLLERFCVGLQRPIARKETGDIVDPWLCAASGDGNGRNRCR